MATRCLGEREGLTFWLAHPDDYDDVMSISDDIYLGNDYLPHRYHTWLDEPGRVVVLARRDTKLVRTRHTHTSHNNDFMFIHRESYKTIQSIFKVQSLVTKY